jgi:hypothetical protein
MSWSILADSEQLQKLRKCDGFKAHEEYVLFSLNGFMQKGCECDEVEYAT